MKPYAVEYLRPEFGRVVVDDDERHEARVHHLEQVFVFELFGGEPQRDFWLALAAQLPVQRDEALVVAARLTYEDFPSREVVQGREGGRLRTGHDDLVDFTEQRRGGEIDELASLRRDRQGAGRDVPEPCSESRQKLVSRDGDEKDVEWVLPLLEIAVDLVLELLERLVDDAALLASLDEIEHPAVDDEHAHHSPAQHRVEVARPLLLH